MDNRNRVSSSSKDNHSWKKMIAILWSQNHCNFLFQIKCEINIYLYINKSLCFIYLFASITRSLCLDYYFKKTIHCVQFIYLFFLWKKWSWRHDFYLHVIKWWKIIDYIILSLWLKDTDYFYTICQSLWFIVHANSKVLHRVQYCPQSAKDLACYT